MSDEKSVFKLLENQGLLAPGEKPEFQWYKDGAAYDPEERFKVSYQDEEDTLALVFQHVKPEDAGLYTCVAATSSGKISCSAELTVQGSVDVFPNLVHQFVVELVNYLNRSCSPSTEGTRSTNYYNGSDGH